MNLLLLELLDSPRGPMTVVLNSHFATYLVGLAVFAAVVWLAGQKLPRATDGQSWLRRLSFGSWAFLAAWSTVAFNLIALIAGTVEIANFWSDGSSHPLLQHAAHIEFTYSAWYMLYGAMLMAVGFYLRIAFLRWQALILLALAIGKVFLFDTSHLSQGYRVMSFLGLGMLLLAISFAYQRDWLALREGSRR